MEEGRHPLNSICELGKQKSMPPSKNAAVQASDYYTRNPSPEGEREKGKGEVDTCHAALIFTRTRVNCESRNTGDRGGGGKGERVDDDEGRAQRDTGMDGWMDGWGEGAPNEGWRAPRAAAFSVAR